MQASTAGTPLLTTNFICRISGLPLSHIDGLRDDECERIAGRMHRNEQWLLARRDSVSECLHTAVGAAVEATKRRMVLQFKRDCYNLRVPPPHAAAAAGEVIEPGARDRVARFARRLVLHERLRIELETVYRRVLHDSRGYLAIAVKEESFQKGLLLSSSALYHAQRADVSRVGTDDKGRLGKTERALLRYLTRAATKATPFSTFCSIVAGRVNSEVDEGTSPGIVLHGDPLTKRSVTRLNKLWFTVLSGYVKRRVAIRSRLSVELNPTLTDVEECYEFLFAQNGREIFRRVPKTPALELVHAEVSTLGDVRLGDLVNSLAAHEQVDATEEEASGFVDKLLSIGLLRFRLGIREQDPDWDLPFAELLDSMEDEHARAIAILLRDLRACAAQYDETDAHARAEILRAVRARCDALFELTGVRTEALEQLPFFEDTTADVTVSITATAAYKHVEAQLGEFVQLTEGLAWPRAEQATMRHFFDGAYGETTAEVPLLRYFEDYYRTHMRAHLDRNEGLTPNAEPYDSGNPFGLELVDEVRWAQKRLVDIVTLRWLDNPEARELALTRADLLAVLGRVPRPRHGANSVSFFAEWITDPETPKGIRLLIPTKYSIGYHRAFSRFLYLFPPTEAKAAYHANARFGDAILAEIGGDGGHNANLHPVLHAWEIRYPGSEPGVAPNHIEPTEIVVVRDPEDPYSLCLIRRDTRERIFPIDMGFVVRESRPPFYRLLAAFMPPCEFQVRVPAFPGHVPASLDVPPPSSVPPNETLTTGPNGLGGLARATVVEPGSGVIRRPRITYNGALVLSRECWRVPALHFPQISPGESQVDFFVRLDRWRRAVGIPREAYVRIWPAFLTDDRPNAHRGAAVDSERPTQDGVAGAAGRRDQELQSDAPAAKNPRGKRFVERGVLNLRKPQYIDFGSPIFVELFGSMAADAGDYIAMIEECYPLRSQLPHCAGQAYALEQVLQVDTPARANIVEH